MKASFPKEEKEVKISDLCVEIKKEELKQRRRINFAIVLEACQRKSQRLVGIHLSQSA
jgi:hypothetical protein